MKILVANLGSTSFKYRLFDMTDESVLARGGVERIGSDQARCFVEAGGQRDETTLSARDHAVAVRLCLQQLADKKCLSSPQELSAIGFKAVHAKDVSGVHRVDEKVLAAMEAFNDVAPAHNPPYVTAMRLLNRELPEIPLVAAFETGFHQTIDPAEKLYAVPMEWATEHGIQRWGFHGASHRYIGQRMTQLLGKPDARIISCHLGGSSSLCAIAAGKSAANSLGMSPQSGLPHNNRVGDFDVFALPAVMRSTGKTLDQVLDDLANRSGMLGLSGCSNDLRNIEAAAGKGDARARQAMDVFVASVRHYLGAYLLLLNGADAIAFTGGIGENSVAMREAVCRNLGWFGIVLDPAKSREAKGEARIDHPDSRVQLWILPTNEELIVARQTRDCLQGKQTMFIARVTGCIVATQKVASMTGHKLLTVEPMRVEPAQRDRLVGTGRTFVCVDTVGAGQGEMVLIVQGSSARLTPETEKLPIDATIIGIVDSVNIENNKIFSAND